VAAADWYPDPTSVRQLRYWDGSAWTTHIAPSASSGYASAAPGTAHAYSTSPASNVQDQGFAGGSPAAVAALPYGVQTAADARRQGLIRAAVIGIGLVLALVAIRLVLASVHFSTFTTNDNSIDEFGYSQTVRGDLAAINQAASGLHPACDKGGQMQACYDADRVMIATLTGVRDSLASKSVPARYAVPHHQLLAALALDAKAFALRNHAIETHSDTEWKTSNDAIGKAASDIAAAVHGYPPGTVLAGP